MKSNPIDPDAWLRAAAGYRTRNGATARITERDIDAVLDNIAADKSLAHPDRRAIDTPAVREWVGERLGGNYKPGPDLKQGRYGDPYAPNTDPSPEDVLRSAWREARENRYDRRVQRRAKDEARERTDREDEQRKQGDQ